jgi:hypothetical protein
MNVFKQALLKLLGMSAEKAFSAFKANPNLETGHAWYQAEFRFQRERGLKHCSGNSGTVRCDHPQLYLMFANLWRLVRQGKVRKLSLG